MLFFRRYPRFTLLLSFLLTASLLLLLTHPPFPSLQPSSDPARPLNSPTSSQGLAARVLRAERAYQKMLLGRDALIAKVGPTPHNVALFPPDREPWPPYTVWDFFPPAFFCPHELERVGELGDGGKWLCGLSQLQEKEDCVVYSVGPPADASFEAELLARTRHCQLFIFDHTASALPRGLSTHATSSAGFDEFYAPLDTLNYDNKLDYWDSRHTLQRAHFKPYRIAGFDAHGAGDTPKTYTLEALMRQNGHSHIDVLKIDLEGWEFDTLKTFLMPGPEYTDERPRVPPVSQMLLELHLWNREFSDLLNWWSTLERAGLRAVAREPNLVYQNYNRMQGAELAEYTFLNVAGPNVFISDEVLVPSPFTAPLPAPPPEASEPPLMPAHEDGEHVR
ncbi:methyltransferase domain-containing protein [Russula ochroleuca]|uniref:Methyltransferase domain-containing protein n=1 Tax=Russula ochroleuca TaxID=152965 RepID=A0A9P5MQ09_9AGAM|nr:methyltransferase domain-containing protein [Russula ochroleuca]